MKTVAIKILAAALCAMAVFPLAGCEDTLVVLTDLATSPTSTLESTSSQEITDRQEVFDPVSSYEESLPKQPSKEPIESFEILADDTSSYEGMTNDEIRDKVERRYGVEVYWNAEIDYPGQRPEPLHDEALIRKFLILLDEQLALYPGGFFIRFRELNFAVRFLPTLYVPHYIIGEEAGGNTEFSDDGYVYITMNAAYWTDEWPSSTTYSGCPYIQYALHHEIGHALEWYIINRAKGFPFDDYVWRGLLPKEFKYHNDLELEARLEIPLLEHGATYMDENQEGIWFCDFYAQMDIREHLASIFGYAMYPLQPDEWRSPNVQDQVEYYFPIIRQVFGTENWPDATHWEQAANYVIR